MSDGFKPPEGLRPTGRRHGTAFPKATLLALAALITLSALASGQVVVSVSVAGVDQPTDQTDINFTIDQTDSFSVARAGFYATSGGVRIGATAAPATFHQVTVTLDGATLFSESPGPLTSAASQGWQSLGGGEFRKEIPSAVRWFDAKTYDFRLVATGEQIPPNTGQLTQRKASASYGGSLEADPICATVSLCAFTVGQRPPGCNPVSKVYQRASDIWKQQLVAFEVVDSHHLEPKDIQVENAAGASKELDRLLINGGLKIDARKPAGDSPVLDVNGVPTDFTYSNVLTGLRNHVVGARLCPEEALKAPLRQFLLSGSIKDRHGIDHGLGDKGGRHSIIPACDTAAGTMSAHELGHNLNLEHEANHTNLMSSPFPTKTIGDDRPRDWLSRPTISGPQRQQVKARLAKNTLKFTHMRCPTSAWDELRQESKDERDRHQANLAALEEAFKAKEAELTALERKLEADIGQLEAANRDREAAQNDWENLIARAVEDMAEWQELASGSGLPAEQRRTLRAHKSRYRIVRTRLNEDRRNAGTGAGAFPDKGPAPSAAEIEGIFTEFVEESLQRIEIAKEAVSIENSKQEADRAIEKAQRVKAETEAAINSAESELAKIGQDQDGEIDRHQSAESEILNDERVCLY